MIDDKDSPEESGRFSEEAPDPSLRESQEKREVSNARQEKRAAGKRREFSDALQEADRNAQQAGGTAAKKLFDGFLQGVGRRAGELVWDILTGNCGSDHAMPQDISQDISQDIVDSL